MKREKYHLRRLGLAAAMLALAGCSAMAPSTGTQQASAAGPPPLVQNCGLVGIGSPSKFACNGKVYTTFQLAKLREDWEKKRAQQ